MAEVQEIEKQEVFVELNIKRTYTSYGTIYKIAEDLGLDQENPHHINALKEAIENGEFTDKHYEVESLVQTHMKTFCKEETMRVTFEELD